MTSAASSAPMIDIDRTSIPRTDQYFPGSPGPIFTPDQNFCDKTTRGIEIRTVETYMIKLLMEVASKTSNICMEFQSRQNWMM